MFITSRESAIFFSFRTFWISGPTSLSSTSAIERIKPSIQIHSGVFWCAEHIATAAEGWQRGYPGFVGFYRVFLDIAKNGLASVECMLWLSTTRPLYTGVNRSIGHQSPKFE